MAELALNAPGGGAPFAYTFPEHCCCRVEVRPVRAEDRDRLLAASNRSAEAIEPWNFVMRDDGDFWHMVEKVDRGEHVVFVATDRGDGGLAGKITVHNVLRGSSQSAALGYSAFLPYAGTGRMTEALRLVVDTCFRPAPVGMGLHRLEINTAPDNARSIALARRLGFRREGHSPRFQLLYSRWRDCDRFALTADEWFPLTCCGPQDQARAPVQGS